MPKPKLGGLNIEGFGATRMEKWKEESEVKVGLIRKGVEEN